MSTTVDVEHSPVLFILLATSCSMFDVQDKEILHAVHRRKIALVVEDVRDDTYRIVHHQAAVDGDAQGFSVDKEEVEGSEEARGRRWCEMR